MALHDPGEEPRQALALLADIGDICAGRDRSIELWLQSYDAFHANTEAAGLASIGGLIGLNAGSDRYGNVELTQLFLHRPGKVKVWDDRHQVDADARERFREAITAETDRRCWNALMEKLGFEQLLDAQAKQEFADSLKGTPPVFTVDNCRATFSDVWANRRELYLRGIANVFMKMDRRFRSHDAFEIGWRLIISYAFSESWSSSSSPHWGDYEKRVQLDDVERIFRELDGLGPLPQGGRISEKLTQQGPLPFVYEDEYFKINCFKNRNIHFQFRRKDLLAKVNELLLEYYKPVEGETGDGPSYEETLFDRAPAKRFGEFFSSQSVVEAVMSRAEIQTRFWDRNKRETINRTPRILEPSAGNGMLAKAARAAGGNVICAEIQPRYVEELRAMGFKTASGDFLKMRLADLGGELFDYIVMNPPFDRGRDVDHVLHAFEMLKPGGTLVAVMSARAEFAEDARHRALRDVIKHKCFDNYHYWTWQDLPERSFAHAGTNVNTVTLRLKKSS